MILWGGGGLDHHDAGGVGGLNQQQLNTFLTYDTARVTGSKTNCAL